MNNLRTVIIGASEGIGEATAMAFAEKKHHLILVARNEQKLRYLQKEMNERYHVNVDIIVCDISDEASLTLCVEKLAAYSIEILVLNAFYCKLGTFAKLSEQDVMTHLKVNVLGHTLLTHKVLPLIKKDGAIYVMASQASFFTAPHAALYFSTKRYFLQFFKTLSYELDDITIKIFCPGFVKTNMIKDNINGNIPFFSMHTPEQIAQYMVNTRKRSRMIHIIGLRNQIMVHLGKCVPDALMARIIGYSTKKVSKQ